MVIAWARARERDYPQLALLHHIPNGGSRNKAEAANLRRQGVKPGVPDLFLPVPVGGEHGLYIEMKFGSNKPTKEQREWLKQLNFNGFRTRVCYSADEAIREIRDYMWIQDERGRFLL